MFFGTLVIVTVVIIQTWKMTLLGKKRKSSGKTLKDIYNQRDRTIDTLEQPPRKFDYLVKYTPPSWATPEPVPYSLHVSTYKSL
jgi:hypothetical protein